MTIEENYEAINTIPVANLVEKIITTDENGGLTVLSWTEACFIKDSRETGMKSIEMYFALRYFTETQIELWNKVVYLTKLEQFYEYRCGKWTQMDDALFKSEISIKCIQYFSESTSGLIDKIYKYMKSFFPIENFIPMTEIIGFADCGLFRADLMRHRFVPIDLSPNHQLTSVIPHSIREIIESIDGFQDFDTTMINLMTSSLETMIEPFLRFTHVLRTLYAYFADLIDSEHEQRFLIMQSNRGAAGKGTITKIIQNILGVENCGILSEGVMQSAFWGMAIQHKRYYTVNETNENFFQNFGEKVKSLTGGDAIDLQIKNGGFFLYQPIGMLSISTNPTPKTLPKEEAIFRRMILARLKNQTPHLREDYENILQSIKDEMPYIIVQLLQLIPHKKRLYDEYDTQVNVREEYEKEQDEEWEFFDLYLKYDTNATRFNFTLYNLFSKFLEVNKIEKDISIRSFNKMLKSYIRNKHWNCDTRPKTLDRVRGINFLRINFDEEAINSLIERWSSIQ